MKCALDGQMNYQRYIHNLKIKMISAGISSICIALAGLLFLPRVGRAEGYMPSIETIPSSTASPPSSNVSISSEQTPMIEISTPPASINENSDLHPHSSTPTPKMFNNFDLDVKLIPNVVITATATYTGTVPNLSIIYGPLIVSHWSTAPIEVDDYLVCDSLDSPLYIPDNDPGGVEDKIYVTDDRLIVDIEVYLNVDHTWVGDLEISLSLDGTQYKAMLIDRPGVPASDKGCGSDNLRTILDDQASQPAEFKCLGYPAAIAGIYQPNNSLDTFRDFAASGSWTLNLSDNSSADTGRLNKWCLHLLLSDQLPPPTPTPTPVDLPTSARIVAISGKDQALPLDCESRSAVDWANYFGKHINELEFFNGLPTSDNPDLGFVGDVNGTWGQIPPNDYGVHADPIADLLYDYGLVAQARKSLTWDELRYEIAESRPVIVWVIGSVGNGAPIYYRTDSYAETSIVANYEHTVIVVGYNADEVFILDGDDIYSRPLDLFLESWSALNNMAVLAGDP